MKIEDLLEMGIDSEQAERILLLAEEEIRAMAEEFEGKEFDYVLEKALAGIRFSSKSAALAFAASLREAGLCVEEGAIKGFEEFLEEYKKDDPDAFAKPVAAGSLIISSAATGEKTGGRAGINALRSAFGLPQV